jgi:hypothetical protein
MNEAKEGINVKRLIVKLSNLGKDIGASSKISVLSENIGGVEQQFADADDDVPPVPEFASPPKTRRKVIRRVVKKTPVLI